jgi:hypothetical protein
MAVTVQLQRVCDGSRLRDPNQSTIKGDENPVHIFTASNHEMKDNRGLNELFPCSCALLWPVQQHYNHCR